MITAEDVRALIVAQDEARPRSRQRRVGPSDLSTPCRRQLGYKVLGVEPAVASGVNLYAFVGTGVHAQMEAVCAADNARLGRQRWLTEHRVSVPLGDGLPELTGSLDAYDADTFTIIDWKTRGANRPSAATRAKHRTQANIYGLGAVLSGLRVDNVAICYIPRNGTLEDIEVDVAAWDDADADAALALLSQLHTVAPLGAGAVLPSLPTADDCRFCRWWQPGAERLDVACPGHNKPPGGDLPPWETQEESKEGART